MQNLLSTSLSRRNLALSKSKHVKHKKYRSISMGNAFYKYRCLLEFEGKVNFFNKTIKNIILNYICLKIITCDNRDPPLIYKDIKELFHEKLFIVQLMMPS